MLGDLISKKTRYEFREYLTGWVLREIEGVFDSAGIEFRQDAPVTTSGQRRQLVEQYYASLDFTNPHDVAKLLRAYEFVLHRAFESRVGHLSGATIEPGDAPKKLVGWLRKDGYDYVDGRIGPISGIARIADVRAAASTLDAPTMHETIRRIEESVDRDPALAIGSAKELIETCCKTILAERGVVDDVEKLELAQLVKRTAKELALVPDAIPDAAKGVESIRRVLSNLASITQGLAEIRNLYGTGHGKSGKARGLSPRHARLAVGSASSLVTFLLDTHKARE